MVYKVFSSCILCANALLRCQLKKSYNDTYFSIVTFLARTKTKIVIEAIVDPLQKVVYKLNYLYK